MKKLAAFTILLLATSTFAGDDENYWKAEVYPSGCAAILHFTGTFSIQDYDDLDPILGVWFAITSPNSNFIGNEMDQLEEGEAHLLLTVQPHVSFSGREKGITVTPPVIKTPSITYESSPSSILSEPHHPGFVIAGNPVREIWEIIVAKKAVSINFELSSGDSYSVGIEGEYLDQVARMFKACIG